jgi:DNA-binding winged helix-turn-helix (wHTH) protein/tetratricopeptide (TPR) repeat protein
MPSETKALYEFGKFRCDPREHLLLCAGKPVSLSPKSFEILVALIQSNGRLLTKDELMEQVWPDSFVEEANLTVNISTLRKVLGETPGGQRYIETVPKRGYRFIAPVREYEGDGQSSPSTPTSGAEQAGPLPGVAPATASRPGSFRWWMAAAGLLLVAILVSAVLFSRRPAKLTDKDAVVLADFANSTGDPVFDGALRQGLSSQLEQSPFLNLLSDERIAQTLSLMAQPKDSRVSHELAREVCLRTASAAVLDGAIAQVGTQYLLTLKAINCSNGESLGNAAARAADKNHVLDALREVASEIRNQLGESLASVQKYDAPAENVTTSSLEALKAYSLGYRAMIAQSDYAAAISLFQRAISLDPNFAMAHARMGTSYSNLNETVRAAESVRRAFELRERASEREKLYIASHYELLVTGNLEAARKVYELSAQTYPRDAPLNNLGLIHSELGDFDKALAAFENVLIVSAGTGNRYANLVSGYLQLNRLDEAKAAAQKAQNHKIDSPEIHLNLYWVAFLQHDAAGMAREKAGMMSKPGYDDQMLNHEADTALYVGQLAKARVLTGRAVEVARRGDEKEAAALYRAEGAIREALVGNGEFAKQQARAALVLSNARDVEALSAIALQMAGDSAQAMRLANNLGKRFPEDTIVQSNYLPAIHAAALLRGSDGPRAMDALAAGPYELGGNLETLTFVLYPVYLRGGAYLAAKQGTAAAAEFQKILDHPGVVRNEPIGALAHLGLGRAYVLSGDQGKAKSAYQDFLTLWKDADPDIPILREAKAEYVKLH